MRDFCFVLLISLYDVIAVWLMSLSVFVRGLGTRLLSSCLALVYISQPKVFSLFFLFWVRVRPDYSIIAVSYLINKCVVLFVLVF